MQSRLLLTVLITLCGVSLYAQGPEPADPSTTTAAWYGSKAGIIAATILCVGILKRFLGDVAGFKKVPTWVYVAGLSGILTVITVQVFGTLPGDLWQTVGEVVLQAGAASGFYEWYNNADKSLARSAQSSGVHHTVKVRKPRTVKGEYEGGYPPIPKPLPPPPAPPPRRDDA